MANSQNGFGKNALEWSVFALGCALLCATIGYLGVEAFTSRDAPPRLEISVGPSRKLNDKGARFLEIRVENSGHTTAQNVEIEVKTPRETASFSLDYVPREGEKSGYVVLSQPFESGQLRARVKSFTQ